MRDREAFEAKVHAKRESGAGIFITLEIQPDDFSEALAMLRVGAHLIVGWEEVASTNVEPIGDDEKPVAEEVRQAPVSLTTAPQSSRKLTGQATDKPDRRPFSTLPLAQQCAIRCADGQFIEWLAFRHSFIWGRTLDFDGVTDHKERAAVAVRSICNINSRSELGRSNHDSDNRWRKLESEYQQWLTDQKYAGAVR